MTDPAKLNNLCQKDSNGWCSLCQTFALPDDNTDELHCAALEQELKNEDYYEEE